jgi:hypothetical protein
MALISQDELRPARVIAEDEDFITLEVAKHDDVKWRVAPLPGEENPQPQQFLTLLFVHIVDGGVEVWTPWEDGNG